MDDEHVIRYWKHDKGQYCLSNGKEMDTRFNGKAMVYVDIMYTIEDDEVSIREAFTWDKEGFDDYWEPTDKSDWVKLKLRGLI